MAPGLADLPDVFLFEKINLFTVLFLKKMKPVLIGILKQQMT